MKQIDNLIISIMSNKNIQKDALKSFREGNGYDIFDLTKFNDNNPYILSENIFEKFIIFANQNKNNKEIFQNIEPFITNKENISDKIFNMLLDFAKNKNEWIYLGLCHANLSEDKVKILKDLNLDESFWY